MFKNNNLSLKVILLMWGMALAFSSCSSDDEGGNEEPVTPVTVEKLDLTSLDNGNKVMMQGFYWDVEPIGEWYNEVATKIDDWAEVGVDRIWMPAPGKGASGKFSMGYDPSDYFDVGEFDQHGTVETRFGSRSELETFIQKSHDKNIEVIADIVMGHNSGGGPQDNPFRNDQEFFTLFNQEFGNASGKFNRDYNHFHPNEIHAADREALFFPETDLCHEQSYVRDWLWNRDDSVAAFYNSLGFDGWRFDYVKSFDPKWVKEWVAKRPGFSVGENFDGNATVLKNWVDAAGVPAFDFACFYKLEETLERFNDLSLLGEENNMLRKIYPDKAVTFVANHDTEKDTNPDNRINILSNKLLAYAYILTHDGYPTIFYSDYENLTVQPVLKNLISIYRSLANGSIEIIKANKDEYIMKRSGNGDNPGLVLYLNISTQTKQTEISSTWGGKTLVDYANNSTKNPIVDASGNVVIEAPGKSFSIWSTAK